MIKIIADKKEECSHVKIEEVEHTDVCGKTYKLTFNFYDHEGYSVDKEIQFYLYECGLNGFLRELEKSGLVDKNNNNGR